MSRLHPTFRGPDVLIDDIALSLWHHDRFDEAETELTNTASEPRDPKHHVLASRALVRTHLKRWNGALADAEMVPVAFLLRSLC